MGTRISGAAVLTAALLLAGCTGEEPDATPSPTPEPSSESSATSATASASAQPSETVAPATGDLVRMSAFTVRAPEGWPVGPVDGPYVDLELLPEGGGIGKQAYGVVALTSFPSVEQRTLDEEARDQRGGKRQEDVVIAGEPAYHVVRPQPGPYTSETFGLNLDSTSISFDFSLFGGSEKQRQDLIASVLASVEWR